MPLACPVSPTMPTPGRALLMLLAVGVWLSAGVARAQVDCAATGTTGVPQVECEALMALYVDTAGSNWTDNTNWDTASAVSTWFGVTVAGGHVTELRLENNQLTGPIPLELGDLISLTILWLQDNQLNGSIPLDLAGLSELTTLYMWNNELTGSIPAELGKLTNLRTLHLSSNQLSGSIPPALSELTNLVGLYAYGNQLTGPIPPELGELTNLTTLYLSGNQLSGPLPPELEKLSRLTSLHLAGNQLTGPIPAWIGNLTNLSTIYLGNNQLSGALPPELGNLTELVSLFIYGNQISGPIPPELGKLTKLTTLYMPSSQLTGPIPAELGNLTSLNTLYLGNNQLSGPIPPELGNLTNLTTAYLQSNQLTGSIPPELGNMSSLDTLYLYGNQLTGSIPPELGNLSNLTSLQLSSNQLTGPIPPELTKLLNLQTLHLYGNQLSGVVPDFSGLPLISLRFSSNAFVFADFEAEFAAYADGQPETFIFSPQARVDTTRTENYPTGAPVNLPSAVPVNPTGNDQYQWYKNGQPIAAPYGAARDLDVTLGVGGVTPADAGAYMYEIRNAVVTDLTLTSQTITLTVSAACGDGFVNDPNEVCDDGNLETGDGCDAACLLEVGEPCADDADCATNRCNLTGMPPVCAPPVGCGNGLLEAGEGCDDGNLVNGDGCSSACEIEDGNPCTSDDDCSSGVCDLTEALPVCEPSGSCGNGVLDVAEACDDGNALAGDGCSGTCLLEDGETCTDSAQCESAICDTMQSNRCEPANRCGNGVLEAGEACEDGNAEAGDGCDASCLFELGAGPCAEGSQCGSGICNTMAAAPVCAAPMTCGNGVRDGDEVCDDGNLDRGDGCSRFCTLENDWRGGGGCAVHQETGKVGLGWLLGLLLVSRICRRKRQAPARSI